MEPKIALVYMTLNVIYIIILIIIFINVSYSFNNFLLTI